MHESERGNGTQYRRTAVRGGDAWHPRGRLAGHAGGHCRLDRVVGLVGAAPDDGAGRGRVAGGPAGAERTRESGFQRACREAAEDVAMSRCLCRHQSNSISSISLAVKNELAPECWATSRRASLIATAPM